MHDAKSAWVPWFAGFLLIAAGWALVTPVNKFPDEVDHVFRAASVVRGEVFPHIGSFTHGTGSIASIPVTLRNESLRYSCNRRLTQDSLCAAAGAGRPASEIIATSEGRRFPLYYALVGWPSLAFPNRTGWMLMRLVSALLCAAFLAAGAYVLMSMPRRPSVLAAGLFVGLTPLALNLSGSVNPSGLEIASAVCFWAVILAMVHDTGSCPPRRLLGWGMASAVALATCREVGCAWIVLAVVLSLISADASHRARFLRLRSARAVLGCGAVATIAVAVWSVVFHSYVVFSTPPASGSGFVKSLRAGAGHVGKLLQQTIGYLGYLTVPTPLAAQVCWAVAFVALVGLAFSIGRRAVTAVVLGCALALVIPFAVEIATYSKSGLGSWQGRYTLPLIVGLPLLAIVPDRPKRTEWKLMMPAAAVIALLTLGGHYSVFSDAWLRVPHPNYWYVPLGDALIACGAAVVVAIVVWSEVAWFRRSTSPGDAPQHPVQWHPPGRGRATRSSARRDRARAPRRRPNVRV